MFAISSGENVRYLECFRLLWTDQANTGVYLALLMVSQRDGRRGPLLTDGYANVFHVLDGQGALCQVSAEFLLGK